MPTTATATDVAVALIVAAELVVMAGLDGVSDGPSRVVVMGGLVAIVVWSVVELTSTTVAMSSIIRLAEPFELTMIKSIEESFSSEWKGQTSMNSLLYIS